MELWQISSRGLSQEEENLPLECIERIYPNWKEYIYLCGKKRTNQRNMRLKVEQHGYVLIYFRSLFHHCLFQTAESLKNIPSCKLLGQRSAKCFCTFSTFKRKWFYQKRTEIFSRFIDLNTFIMKGSFCICSTSTSFYSPDFSFISISWELSP